MPHKTLRVSVLLVSFVSVYVAAFAGDWNQWRGPDRSGLASDSPELLDALPANGLKPAWLSEEIPGGSGWSSPIVADGRVVVFAHTQARRPNVELPAEKYPELKEDARLKMSKEERDQYEANRHREQIERRKALYEYHETLYCLDARTGDEIWTNRRESGHTQYRQSATPAVIDGTLYAVGADRTVRAVDFRDGRELWLTKLPAAESEEPICSSPALADGVVVMLAGQLFGVDAGSGRLLWTDDAEKTKGFDSSPVVWQHQGRQWTIANVVGRDTVCIEPKTGREVWRIESQAGRSTPVVAGDLLITYGDSRKNGVRCFRLSLDTPEEVWAYQGVSDPGSSPVVVGDHVYVQGENRLACLNLADGQPAWRTTLDVANPRYTSLAAADGKIFYAWDGVLCFAADPSEYRQLYQAKIDATAQMATPDYFRDVYDIDDLQAREGQEKALQHWKNKVDNQGPMDCVSPALSEGRLFLRLRSRVVCYDLRKVKSGR